MSQNKKGLGRGLAALIPGDEMDLLSSIARGELSLLGDHSQQEAANTVFPDETAASLSVPALQSPPKQSKVSLKLPEEPAALVAASGKGSKPSQKPQDPIPRATPPVLIRALNESEVLVEWLLPNQIGANPYQPRRTFDAEELADLTASIREHGILQPIIVRPWPKEETDGAQTGVSTTNPPFQLIAGERRWRASQAAGLQHVPVVVRHVSDQQALELAVIENVQRHDISPLDAALAYRRLASEFGLSQEKIAQRVGKSRSSVANTQRLLELPIEAQNALQDGTLSEGHGRAILLATGDGARRAAFRTILRDRLSVRDAEELSRRISREQNEASAASKKLNDTEQSTDATTVEADVQKMIELMQQKTGCRIQFRPRRQGGHFVLHCASAEQMQRIAELLS